MKPHIIELERLDSMADEGLQLELQGAMSISVDPNPHEGVYESKLRLSRSTATKLHAWLTNALKR